MENQIKNAENNPRIKFGIDREEENRDVREYAESGNELIFNKIYERRLPTIDFLSKRYHWLCEDAASEICIVLMRAVGKYKKGQRTDFNTYFFTSVKNHFSNLAKKRFRKKRTTFDGLDPLNRTLPLDSFINEDEGSSDFHEFIADGNSDFEKIQIMEDCLYRLSKGNKFLEHVVKQFSNMSKRQIAKKELTFEFTFDLVSGDLFEDVCKQVGLSKRIFDVAKVKVHSGVIEASVRIKGKSLVKYFIGQIESQKEEVQEIKG